VLDTDVVSHVKLIHCSQLSLAGPRYNSLIIGASSSSIHKFQRIQNTFARTVLESDSRYPVEPLLERLHLLLIHSRICIKLIYQDLSLSLSARLIMTLLYFICISPLVPSALINNCLIVHE
jgi:hypothetical protein